MRKISLLAAAGLGLVLSLRFAATVIPGAFSGRGFALAVLGLMAGVAALLFVFFLMLSMEQGILGKAAVRRVATFAVMGAGLLLLSRLSQLLALLGLSLPMARHPFFEVAEWVAFAGIFLVCRKLLQTARDFSWTTMVRAAEIGKWSFGLLSLISLALVYNSATGGRLLGTLVRRPLFPPIFFVLSLLLYIGVLFFFISFARGLEDQPNQEEIPD